MALKLKPGVIMAGLSPVMRPVLIHADRIMKSHGVDLVITSALDGAHSPGSFHYYGFALDIRSKHLSQQDKLQVLIYLIEELPDYQVCLECKGLPSEHFHIESEKGFYRHVQKINSGG